MIFYSQETAVGLGLANILVLAALIAFLYYRKEKAGLLLLLLGAFALRLLIISLDPYLCEWDERFHALVAKNMMQGPFEPMLRVNPVMPYNIELWCCNHIWVHKQPLFLWQMALSMKMFGINEIALRLPSAIAGTIAVYFIYDIAKAWTKDINIAFLAALLLCLSNYHLELTSGRISLEHNDLIFSFYVTASIWAFSRYVHNNYSYKWALLIGIFTGAAILVKWLTGFLIFGGWGLYLLLTAEARSNYKHYLKYIFSLLVASAVFLPWQIYIMNAFPVESAIMYAHNKKHIFEALDGHKGDMLTHLRFLTMAYGTWFLPFIPIGIALSLLHKDITKALSMAYIAMVIVIFAFFSIIVATKMPAFPFPVHSIVWIFIALGLVKTVEFVLKQLPIKPKPLLKASLFLLLFSAFGYYALNPSEIKKHRSVNNEWRNIKIHNAQIYRNLDVSKLENRIILNCNSFEETELMFYKNVNAYNWYPEQKMLDSLLQKGYKFAAFKNHSNYVLPPYISENKDILIIPEVLK